MNVRYRLAGEGPSCVQGWTPQVLERRDPTEGPGERTWSRSQNKVGAAAMSQGLTADLRVAAAAMDPQGCDQRHSLSTGSDAPYMTEDSVSCM